MRLIMLLLVGLIMLLIVCNRGGNRINGGLVGVLIIDMGVMWGIVWELERRGIVGKEKSKIYGKGLEMVVDLVVIL